WVPLPFLAVVPNRDEQNREQLGPTNWCRARLTAVEGGSDAVTHQLVIAFDTETVPSHPGRPYVGPSLKDAQAEREFALAGKFRDIAWFLSDMRSVPGSAEEMNFQEWVDRWVDELFVEFKVAQRGGRPMREEDRQPLEHAARY